MKSIHEISIIEEADGLGAKSLGIALDALILRWDSGLTDDETFIRMLFLKWYSLCEPNWYNGLPVQEDRPLEKTIDSKGDLDTFSNEIKFTIGVLAHLFPWCFGEEEKWKKISTKLLTSVEGNQPDSSVFINWKYSLGISTEVNGLRKKLPQSYTQGFLVVVKWDVI